MQTGASSIDRSCLRFILIDFHFFKLIDKDRKGLTAISFLHFLAVGERVAEEDDLLDAEHDDRLQRAR